MPIARMTVDASRLSAELETAVVRELMRAWHSHNYTYFREALRPPAIELGATTGKLGHWSREHRTIMIARSLVVAHPWSVVLEVLKHEMAHQYVHEVLAVLDESAHGPAFRDVCARLGVDASAHGLPRTQERSDEEARVLDRIHRLLALAQSSNEHEAQSAMNAAQKLMLKHNLETAGKRPHGFRHLGAPTGRVQEPERILATLLGDHFFVETIWVPVYRPLEGKRATVLEICGAEANLEMASYVYDFLRDTAERLWVGHKKARGIRENKDRQKFLAGVMLGFREKLREQAQSNRAAGLVWVKDGDLVDFFRRRHPRVRHVQYGGGRPSEAYAHGRAAGRNIVLHRPVAGSPAARGLLLGAGRRG